MWARVGACAAARPRLQGGASQKLPSLLVPSGPTSPEPSQATSEDTRCHPPPAARQAQPEPAPAFTTMFKGLSKGTQGKGSPKGSPVKGSPKGSPSKHSR